MSQVALHLYRKLHEARNDEARSDAIVEAFSELEERFPGLKDTATRQHLGETELRLQKEIEGVRLEIKQVEGNLRKEIEQVRLEIKQVEGSLRKEIEQVRLEIEQVRLEIEKNRTDMKRIELEMARAMHRQTLWVVGSIGTLITVIRLLDWFLAHGTH
jgi:hypothetical protein